MDRQISTVIDAQKCIGCGRCVVTCPAQAFTLAAGKSVVSGQRCILCGHCLAVCPTGAASVPAMGPGAGAVSMRGFALDRSSLAPGDFDAAHLARLMGSRRSCRDFAPQPVDRSLLEDLAAFGRLAPSASNYQPWAFTLLATRPAVERLVDEVATAFAAVNRLAQNPAARALMALLGRRQLADYRRDYLESMLERVGLWRGRRVDRFFYGAPAAMVISAADEGGMPAADCLLAGQNVMLAAHALGLGSCFIGFAVSALARRPKAKAALGLPAAETAHVVLALGYCREKFISQAGRLSRPVRWVER